MREYNFARNEVSLVTSCMRCKKYITCEETCVYVDMLLPVNTYSPEITADDNVLTADYKEVLNELREGREQLKKVNIGKIRRIKDVRLRAIAGMIYSRVSIFEIAALLDKSVSQIYRIVSRGQSQI
ncbi:MAG: hypothetical protein L7F77_04640 [Candidatus Magnetominusculus sp. LBB02]|nr:hypothetical protein [Candidatus Magnetominusculus sp. LBB02]